MRFSERQGYRSPKDIIQSDGMDDDLRIGLWNALHLQLWRPMGASDRISEMPGDLRVFLNGLWHNFFKYPLDTLGSHSKPALKHIRDWYFSSDSQWYDIYDFVEYIAQRAPQSLREILTTMCNGVMERELSAYRFVGGTIARITGAEEIDSIEQALSEQTACTGARAHIGEALAKLSDRQNPDYRNSIKESISAVEAIVNVIAGKNSSLGKALDLIESKGELQMHKSLKAGYDKLYGYTSNADGIRHSMLEEPDLHFEDAYYMLVSCSAFVNYLVAKAKAAGIGLT